MFREFVIILLILAICWMIRKTATYEQFDDELLYENESMRVMKNCEFSLDCCPSTYSNDRGCMCMEEDEMSVFGTRGFNSYHPN